MKAIAVIPGQAGSIHLAELDEPSVRDVPNGRGVLVKVMRVGLCGTDREITAAEYGQAPEGYNFLVLGHECMGQVVEVGDAVTEFEPGDYVVPTVRRAGTSIYDDNGQYDMSTDDVYWERGINLLHGYLTEYFVEQPQYLVKVPRELREVTVLLEPTAIIEKGIIQGLRNPAAAEDLEAQPGGHFGRRSHWALGSYVPSLQRPGCLMFWAPPRVPM